MKAEIDERLALNLDRVRNLVNVYSALAGLGQGRRPVHSSDILRAATVLLHAALEDFLRSLELWRLPSAPNEALASLPLAGTQGRGERLTLAQLAAHRGKTVDALIRESVAQHLERKSYNNTTDVIVALARVNLDTTCLQPHLASLAALIERRHHIVHQADRELATGSGHHPAKSISRQAVITWLTTVEASTSALLSLLPDGE